MDDPLKSPPSSPEGVSPTTRKRSHEEMKGEATETQEFNSSTTVGDADAASIQNKQNKNETSSLSSTIKPSTQASNMPPPSVPASKMSSQQPPRSGQGSTTNSQSSQPGIKTKNVTDSSAVEQKADTDADGDSSTDDDEEEEELDSPTLSEPHEQIEMFDWDDLQQRYHDKTRQLDSEEATIMDEFHALCDASLLSPSRVTVLTVP